MHLQPCPGSSGQGCKLEAVEDPCNWDWSGDIPSVPQLIPYQLGLWMWCRQTPRHEAVLGLKISHSALLGCMYSVEKLGTGEPNVRKNPTLISGLQCIGTFTHYTCTVFRPRATLCPILRCVPDPTPKLPIPHLNPHLGDTCQICGIEPGAASGPSLAPELV